jgi:hypothetical protein
MAKTKSRNRLKSITTDKVLYICCNERLKQKTQKILYQEEYLQWLEAAPEADALSADLLADHNSARSARKNKVVLLILLLSILTHHPTTPPPITHQQKSKASEKEKESEFRSVFKPIGRSYTKGLVVKKLKAADGSPTTTAKLGIADEHIHKSDTVVVPISQFSFTPKQIEEKFDGDVNFLLRGVVTNVTKVRCGGGGRHMFTVRAGGGGFSTVVGVGAGAFQQWWGWGWGVYSGGGGRGAFVLTPTLHHLHSTTPITLTTAPIRTRLTSSSTGIHTYLRTQRQGSGSL